MKSLNFFVAFLLFATLSACGSGSSNEPGSTASTNIEPTTNDSTGPNASAELNDDQPNSADDTDGIRGDDGSASDTDGGTDSTVSTDESDGGNTESDGGNTSVAADNDSGVVTDDGSSATDGSGEADTDGGGETDADGVSDADGGTDSSDVSNSDDSGDTASGDGGDTDVDNTDPAIDPDSALAGLQSRIKTLTGRTLLALNQSLSQGEILSAQQEQCLGTYDPAIGEPLLSIDCDQPLATGEVPIFASVASLKDTPECRTSLQNANADACSINQSEFSVSPIFTTPESGRPQVKQAGAAVSYNIVQDRLIVENLTPPLTGTFYCEYDLTTGNAVGGDPGGNCYNQINRICDLIDEQLAIEN